MKKPDNIQNIIPEKIFIWDTITTTVYSFVGRGAGFVVPFFIAAWFGVSGQTDAFFFAYGIIILISGLFAPILEAVIVSHIADIIKCEGDVGGFVGNIICISGLAIILFSGAVSILIMPFLSAFTRFGPDEVLLIQQIICESLPLVVLLVWTSILSGAFNSYKIFIVPAVAPALRAGVTIAFIYLFKNIMNVHAIAFGYIVGELFRLLVLLALLNSLKLFALRLSFRLDYQLRMFLGTAFYQTVGMVIISFNPVINKIMASWVKEGGVSILEYADRLYMIPVALVSSGLLVTALSYWSSGYHKDGVEGLAKGVSKVSFSAGAVAVLISFILIIFSWPIVRLAYYRGSFNPIMLPDVRLTFVLFLTGLAPYILAQIFVRAFIVLKNTKVLVKCAIYNVMLTVIFNLIFTKHIGIAGIALSASLVSVFNFIYLKNILNRVISIEGGR